MEQTEDIWRAAEHSIETGFAVPGEFTLATCMAGLLREPAFFGTLGVLAPNKVPEPRYEGVGWVDANQNFWLFGGFLRPNPLRTFYYNRAWKRLP